MRGFRPDRLFSYRMTMLLLFFELHKKYESTEAIPAKTVIDLYFDYGFERPKRGRSKLKESIWELTRDKHLLFNVKPGFFWPTPAGFKYATDVLNFSKTVIDRNNEYDKQSFK